MFKLYIKNILIFDIKAYIFSYKAIFLDQILQEPEEDQFLRYPVRPVYFIRSF